MKTFCCKMSKCYIKINSIFYDSSFISGLSQSFYIKNPSLIFFSELLVCVRCNAFKIMTLVQLFSSKTENVPSECPAVSFRSYIRFFDNKKNIHCKTYNLNWPLFNWRQPQNNVCKSRRTWKKRNYCKIVLIFYITTQCLLQDLK